MTRQIPQPDPKPLRLGDLPYERVEVVCNICGHSGSNAKARLVAKYGVNNTFPNLRQRFEATCSRSKDIARLNEVCGIVFPDLVRWTIGNWRPSIRDALRDNK